MYGKGDTGFPQRLVCLSSEHVEICYALGAGERVVGVPGTAHRPPEAREKPKVGGFTSFRLDKILELEPDLVLSFSDLQADVSAQLIRAGLPVFCSNPRSVDEILATIIMVGGLLGLERSARDLVQDMRDEIRQVRVDPGEVAKRDPQIILASWCGKPVDVDAIRRRPGWEGVSAVKAGRIHEVDGPDILSPGPSVLAGLRHIHEIIQQGLGR